MSDGGYVAFNQCHCLCRMDPVSMSGDCSNHWPHRSPIHLHNPAAYSAEGSPAHGIGPTRCSRPQFFSSHNKGYSSKFQVGAITNRLPLPHDLPYVATPSPLT